MSKVTNYMMLMAGMVLLLTFAGIPTGTHKLLEKINLLEPSEITTPPNEDTDFSWDSIKGLTLFEWIVLGLGIAGGLASIVIGFFTKSSAKDMIVGIIAGLIAFFFTSEFIQIIIYVKGNYLGVAAWSWVSYIVSTVYGMLMVGFLMSVLDFYQGGT